MKRYFVIEETSHRDYHRWCH